jgi:hypothetical protein
MPQIKEYSSQIGASGPIGGRNATAQDFGAGVGQAVEGFGQALSYGSDVVQKRAEQSELSDYYAKQADKRAELTAKFKERARTAKPGDPKFTEEVLQDFDSEMGKLSEGLTQPATRQYASRANAEMRGHFQEMAYATQAELAGAQVSQNFRSTLSKNSSTLVSDPTQLQSILSQHDAYVDTLVNPSDGSKGFLSTEQAIKLKADGRAELAVSAVKGWVELNPDAALKNLKEGGFDDLVNGPQKDKLIGEAQEKIRANFYEDQRIKRVGEEERDKSREVTLTKFIDDIGNSRSVSAKDIEKSDLSPSAKSSLYSAIASKKHDFEDSATFNKLLNRVHGLDESNPSEPTDVEIIQAFNHKQIPWSAVQLLRNERLGKNTVEGKNIAALKNATLKAAKQEFEGTGFIKNPESATSYSQFVKALSVKEAEYRREGKSLDALYSADTKEVQALMAPFKKSAKEIIQMQSARIGGAAKAAPVTIEERIPQAEDGKKQSQFDYVLKKVLSEHHASAFNPRESVEKKLRDDWKLYEDMKKDSSRYSPFTVSRLRGIFEDSLPDAPPKRVDPANAAKQRQPGESPSEWKARTGGK